MRADVDGHPGLGVVAAAGMRVDVDGRLGLDVTNMCSLHWFV